MRKMKLLLCHPNQTVSFDGMKARPMVGPPMGILLIAGYLRNSPWNGEIEVYDSRLSAQIHLNKKGQKIFGDTDEVISNRILESAADVVGISNMFSSQIERAYELADVVRIVLPKATIVIGGPHVSILPEEAIKRSSIDYVVTGEGEVRFTKLMLALSLNQNSVIEGVYSKNDIDKIEKHSKNTFINDLDSLPLPAYDLVDMEEYFKLSELGYSPRYREWGKRPMALITSRGCPHNCSFCSIHSTMGYKYRYNSPEYIQNHINLLVKNYGVDFIHFEDDNLTHLPERYDSIIDALIKTRSIEGWDTPNGVRGDTWTFERVQKAKKSGCQYLSVAIESPVHRVLNQIIHKDLNLSHVENLMRWCKTVKLRLHAFYIIGFPGETIQEMNATVKYALFCYLKYGVTPFLQPLIPIPNTPIYQKILEGSYYEEKCEIRYNQITTDNFNPEQVHKIYKTYLWIRIAIFIFRSVTSLREFLYSSKLIFKYPHAVIHALISAVRAKG